MLFLKELQVGPVLVKKVGELSKIEKITLLKLKLRGFYSCF